MRNALQSIGFVVCAAAFFPSACVGGGEGEGASDEGEASSEGEGSSIEGEGSLDEGEGSPEEGEGSPDEGEGSPDEGEPCTPETNAVLCGARECGQIDVVDRCGTQRTPLCGTCDDPDVCGGTGIVGVCGFRNALWDFELIDDEDSPGSSMSIAVRGGEPAVVYGAATGQIITTSRFAARESGVWTVTPIREDAVQAGLSLIVQDEAFVIAFNGFGTSGLLRVDDAGPTFVEQVVTTISGGSVDVALASDNTTRLCLSHGEFMESFAENAGGEFDRFGTGIGLGGGRCRLVVDGANRSHVVFRDPNFFKLVYVVIDGDERVEESFATYGDLDIGGSEPDIAIDDVGTTFILYTRPGVIGAPSMVSLIERSAEGVFGEEEIIDDAIDVIDAQPSLALVAGEPVVTYHDAARGHLLFARRQNGLWTKEVIASQGDINMSGQGENAIAVAGTSLHIAFREAATGATIYAVRQLE